MAVKHSPPVDLLNADFPLRLTTGRRLESFNTGVQTGGYDSPLHVNGEALRVSPEDGARYGLVDGGRALVTSRRGAVEAPVAFDTTLRPGLAFMNLHFPELVDTNVLTIDATDPRSGTAEFKATAIRVEAVVVPDLRLLTAEPSDAERDAIDAVLGPPPAANDRMSRAEVRRHELLPALRAAQRRVGWVSEGALGYATRRLQVPPAEAYGVATFYALIALDERPADVTHVCTDLVCALKGATVGPGEQPSPCLGLCERAPAKYRTVAGEEPFEEQLPPVSPPLPQREGLRLLRRVAEGVDPTSLDAYVGSGGFAQLTRARELGAEAVIAEVSESKLVGRGGAAFPTGTKWKAVLGQAAQPHYVVCNGDESEPGTFKDRVLMESDPFGLVEAMAIAGFATGSTKAYVYIRAEYTLAHERIQHAIDASAPYLDGFEIELRIGAGAYVCGEETALFQSIEGKRGEPRNKPPFPVEVGLFGKPTAENNVETLFNVLEVLRLGGAEYAKTGHEGLDRDAALLRHRLCRASRAVRAAVRCDAARAARARRLKAAEGSAARRRRGRLRRAGAARPEADARGHTRGGRDARLGCRHRLRRRRGARTRAPAHRRVLPRRVVRAVRAVPRRHGPAGGGAPPPRRRPAARG